MPPGKGSSPAVVVWRSRWTGCSQIQRSNALSATSRAQWLQLYRLGMFPPDPKLYPDYDVWLEASMREEVVHFFREVFANNLPVDRVFGLRLDGRQPAPLRILRAARTKNRPAFSAYHCALKITAGGAVDDGRDPRADFRWHTAPARFTGASGSARPSLASRRHRHRRTSTRSSPNPPDSPKATIRQKLAAHAEDANCAACHRKIDPLGPRVRPLRCGRPMAHPRVRRAWNRFQSPGRCQRTNAGRSRFRRCGRF